MNQELSFEPLTYNIGSLGEELDENNRLNFQFFVISTHLYIKKIDEIYSESVWTFYPADLVAFF